MNRKTIFSNLNLYILLSIILLLFLTLFSSDSSLLVKIAFIAYTIIFCILLFSWIWMLVDCLQRSSYEFHTERRYMKLVWLIVIIFGNILGAILYYNFVKSKDYLQTKT